MDNKRFYASLTRHVWGHAQRHSAGSAILAKFCDKYLGWYNNHDYQMERNGEFYVLDVLKRFDVAVVFDVGANVGDWSAKAVATLPDSTIHAFEIAPSVACVLTERFPNSKRVVINGHGLSDAAGQQEIDFYVAGTHTGTTMLVDQRIHVQEESIRQLSSVERGEDYCQRNHIENIDFLKVDAEGAEPQVFRGFERMLRTSRIGLVQFEYNSINIGTRYLLRDFFELFEGYGYSVGKLWPRGVSFGPYDFRDEDFIGPNYLAVHESRDDLKKALYCEGFR